MKHILIYGCGKVGTALSKAFSDIEEVELIIANRTDHKPKELATHLGIPHCPTARLSDLELDMIIIAVADDHIGEVSQELAIHQPDVPQCHTSGSTSIEVLADGKTYGLFYPLDSFGYPFDDELQDTPILIEANDDDFLEDLYQVAAWLSDDVREINYENRQYLHLSAVMVNNFTNALVREAYDILEQRQLDHSLLNKLLQTTFHKIMEDLPENSQTGPALRRDEKTINHHVQLIKKDSTKDLYRLLTQMIQNQNLEK